MKKILIALAALTPILAMADHHNETPAAKTEATSPLRHIVCLKFNEGTTPAQIKKIETEFVALKGKINTITGLEWGTNVSPEDRAKGFTHCFVVSFKDMAGLEVYGPHAAHQAFVAILKPVLDDVFVFDFIAK